MVYESNKKYFRKCDCCGDIKEIKKQSFLKNLHKQNHYCLSCKQKGDRNHRFGKSPWNKSSTKNNDIRIRNGAEKISMAKKGCTPWNSGHTYEELKGKNWSNNFKSKISLVKKGVPNYKNRRIIDKSKPASYFRRRCRALLYSEWVSKVLKRDNYTCQLCGYKRELEVHHIRKFSKILEIVADRLNLNLHDYKEFTDSEFEVFRDEVIKEHKLDDGITLCRECHKGVDNERSRFFAFNKQTISQND